MCTSKFFIQYNKWKLQVSTFNKLIVKKFNNVKNLFTNFKLFKNLIIWLSTSNLQTKGRDLAHEVSK